MRHLILGSSGQIGTALTKYLRSINETVIEFDIKRSIDEDIRYETDNLDRAICDSDFVYFLAFNVGGARYLDENQNKIDFIDDNMRIMSNTFNYLRLYKKPFIFASSPNYPSESYGMLKRLGEKMTLDIGGIVTRFWNVYDVEPTDDHAHVITDFIHMAKTNGSIKMRTNGRESRQFLYGGDCAEAVYQISQHFNDLDDKLQNITTFKWYTIRDVANYINTEFGGKISVFPGPKNDGQNDAMILPSETDILKYWQPKIDLKDGIKTIIKNSRSL